MIIVLCRDPLEPSHPDRAFNVEIAAIERQGLPHILVDHDALVRGDDPLVSTDGCRSNRSQSRRSTEAG